MLARSRLSVLRNGLSHSNTDLPHRQLFFPRSLRAASTATPRHFDLLAIDQKWKQKWAEEPAPASPARVQDGGAKDKEKAYILAMFPYPSGALHMGHLRVYTISDILSRYKRMKGYDVLHPMAWDAFGLPAENAAIERGINPADWTRDNIENMKKQLKAIGAQFDWDREFMTCSPSFYKHTQRLFLMLYERGLAYQAEAMVNYDPVDKTVLANEQVDAEGRSWRSGAKVEKLNLKQWYIRITDFKESLLKDLDSLEGGWPERVLSMQRHWLGKSTGAKIKFDVVTQGDNVPMSVFTTRPDTLYGVKYLALSLDHPLVREMAKTTSGLQEFIDSASSLPSDSKAGFRLPGINAINPLSKIEQNDVEKFTVPVYVAPYVLGDYGEGAVMGVPGHDARDLAFWRENTGSEPIPLAVNPASSDSASQNQDSWIVPSEESKPFTGDGIMSSLSGKYKGQKSAEARTMIVQDLSNQGGLAQFEDSWRIRDWLISRQRYWGTPIPIIHCGHCGPVPVPSDQLPVELPKVEGAGLQGKGGTPLESAEDWLHTSCPECKRRAKRDTDTMDTFVDSSWYFMRFPDASNKDLPFSPSSVRAVDTYVGGVEHAILHLLYARFIYKFLSTTDLFPQASAGSDNLMESHEPFRTLLSQGMVHGKTYSDPSTGRFLHPSELDLTDPKSPLIKGTKTVPTISFEKMSKSKHNGVDPSTCVSKYGADATRAHVLFSAPVSEVLEWDESKIVGIQRWYNRVWKIVTDARGILGTGSFALTAQQLEAGQPMSISDLDTLSDSEAEILLAAQSTLSSVSHCLEKNPYGLNTVISDLTKFTNSLASSIPTSKSSTPSSTTSQAVIYTCISTLLRLLSPVAPALTSECWEILHDPILNTTSTTTTTTTQPTSIPPIFSSPWPDPILTPEQEQALRSRGRKTVAIQINGKFRFKVDIPQRNAGDPSTSTTTNKKEEEDNWIISQILDSEQGQLWLRTKNDWEKRRRVVVVGGGKVVNVVF